MICGSNVNGSVNRLRLVVLVGFLAMFGLVTMITAFAIPGLFGVFPILLLAATCPAMCSVRKVSSWVKGGITNASHAHTRKRMGMNQFPSFFAENVSVGDKGFRTLPV
jgi:hypothetical protein